MSSEKILKIPLDIQSKLKNFVKEQTIKRCKGISKSVQEAIDTLKNIFTFPNKPNIKNYSIPKNVFDTMLSKANEIMQHKFDIGINEGRVTKANVSKYIRLQNFWLHIAPETTTKYLYNQTLTFTANYFDDISFDTTNIPFTIHQIREFLKKKFLFNLMTAHLQQNKQSTKHGPIIQDSAWKQQKLQRIITDRFDISYLEKWPMWMQLTTRGNNGKLNKMRISSIMKEYVKPFVKCRLVECMKRLGINMEIKEVEIKPNEIGLFGAMNIAESISSYSNSNSLSELMSFTSFDDFDDFNGFNGFDDNFSFDNYDEYPPSIPYVAPVPVSYHSIPSVQPPINNNNNNNHNHNNNHQNITYYGPSKGPTTNVQQSRHSPITVTESNKIKIERLQQENAKFREEIFEYKRILQQYQYQHQHQYQQQHELHDNVYRQHELESNVNHSNCFPDYNHLNYQYNY